MDGGPLPALHDMRVPERPKFAAVPHEEYGSPVWEQWLEPLLEVGEKKRPGDARGWADDFMRAHYDRGDLRALGFCRCGAPGHLVGVGHCVYWSGCDHYRAQGTLSKMQAYLANRALKISPERRASLLALIGR